MYILIKANHKDNYQYPLLPQSPTVQQLFKDINVILKITHFIGNNNKW